MVNVIHNIKYFNFTFSMSSMLHNAYISRFAKMNGILYCIKCTKRVNYMYMAYSTEKSKV